MQMLIAGAIMALALVATPAAATRWLVLGSATAVQTPTNPPGTTRLEVPQLSGQLLQFGFVVNTDVPGFDNAPPGGVGQSRSYFTAIETFGMTIGGNPFELAPGAGSQLFVLNDVGGNPAQPNSRLDQVTMNMGVVFQDGAPVFPLLTDAPLPTDGFVSSLTFGRTLVGTIDAPPQLVGSAAIPALDQVWLNGPTFMTFQVRAGTPGSPFALAQLPVAYFGATGLQFQLFELPGESGAVPEPATWAMMIMGFGFVGAAMRRRRVVAATA